MSHPNEVTLKEAEIMLKELRRTPVATPRLIRSVESQVKRLRREQRVGAK